MFINDEIGVLEIESEAIKNFNCELPKEKASIAKKAAKMAENNILEGLDLDNVTIFGSNRKKIEDEEDILPNLEFGVGLTKGLDFYNLHKQNPEWLGEPIQLATDEDLLHSHFFIDGEQNEKLREYRKNAKTQCDEDDDEDDE
jgi:predicted nucleotidyltransferase